MFKVNLFLAILLCNCIYVSFANPPFPFSVEHGQGKTYVKIYQQLRLGVCAFTSDPPSSPPPVPMWDQAVAHVSGKPYQGDWISFKVDYSRRTEAKITPNTRVNDLTVIQVDGIRNKPFTQFFRPSPFYKDDIFQLPPDEHRCIEVWVTKTGIYGSQDPEEESGPMYYYPTIMFINSEKWQVDHIDKVEYEDERARTGRRATRLWDVHQSDVGQPSS